MWTRSRLLQFSVTGNATQKGMVGLETGDEISQWWDRRVLSSSTLDPFPRAALFQCIGTYKKWTNQTKSNNNKRGHLQADAASSRKLKTGEVAITQTHSCQQSVQCTFLLFHLTECQNVSGWLKPLVQLFLKQGHKQHTQNRFPTAMSKRLFRISKEGDSTTSHCNFLIHKYLMLNNSVKSPNEC